MRYAAKIRFFPKIYYVDAIDIGAAMKKVIEEAKKDAKIHITVEWIREAPKRDA